MVSGLSSPTTHFAGAGGAILVLAIEVRRLVGNLDTDKVTCRKTGVFRASKIAGWPLAEVLWGDALNFLQKLGRTACKLLGQADVRHSDASEPRPNRGALLKEKRRQPFGRRRSLPKTGKDYTSAIRQAQARSVLIYRVA
jgi:hypothetical protein